MAVRDALASLPAHTLVSVSLPRKRDSITLGRGAYASVQMTLGRLASLIDGDPAGDYLQVRVLS